MHSWHDQQQHMHSRSSDALCPKLIWSTSLITRGLSSSSSSSNSNHGDQTGNGSSDATPAQDASSADSTSSSSQTTLQVRPARSAMSTPL
jgi:hypothetical protein